MVTLKQLTEAVELAERVAFSMGHPAARNVSNLWCDMSPAMRKREDVQAQYKRFYCKFGIATGPCRCGYHDYKN